MVLVWNARNEISQATCLVDRAEQGTTEIVPAAIWVTVRGLLDLQTKGGAAI
jgi:hypothetical protein